MKITHIVLKCKKGKKDLEISWPLSNKKALVSRYMGQTTIEDKPNKGDVSRKPNGNLVTVVIDGPPHLLEPLRKMVEAFIKDNIDN